MLKEKHPIFAVLVIIGITVLILGAMMTLLFYSLGITSNLSLHNRIGIIQIEGTISDSQKVVSQIVEFRKDRRIKAIILRINSPGGGVGPSQEIYQEVKKTIKTKKIIASMGSIAASGGYYVASAADKIVANPGTITGSIGVIMEFLQVEDLLKKIGVGLEVVKSGKFKDIGSPHRRMTDQDRELIMKGVISDIKNQFIRDVARGRKIEVEKVEAIADGRIFSGERAKELGLVDVLGNFQDAVTLAKELSGIKGEATLIYPKKAKIGLWDFLFQDASEALVKLIMEKLGVHIAYRWDGPSSVPN